MNITSKCKGEFSVEYIFQQCFMRKHTLFIELSTPIVFKGETVSECCVLRIAENEDVTKDLLQRALKKENSDGILMVNAFTESPFNCEIVSIDTRNILSVELINNK